MTVINGQNLLNHGPILNMIPGKVKLHGVSHGLGEAGYDIRIKQALHFIKDGDRRIIQQWTDGENDGCIDGRFTLASAIEEFDMPNDLVGIVHDKSTWARKGLTVCNTVIEPGWKGFLTLELIYHGEDELMIPAGAGIAQVIFHQLSEAAVYDGKYQNAADRPQIAIES